MAEERDDDFKDAKRIKGLEHLGRAIVDENGVPSGSPANYEALRGAGLPGGLPVAEKAIEDAIKLLQKEHPRDAD